MGLLMVIIEVMLKFVVVVKGGLLLELEGRIFHG